MWKPLTEGVQPASGGVSSPKQHGPWWIGMDRETRSFRVGSHSLQKVGPKFWGFTVSRPFGTGPPDWIYPNHSARFFSGFKFRLDLIHKTWRICFDLWETATGGNAFICRKLGETPTERTQHAAEGRQQHTPVLHTWHVLGFERKCRLDWKLETCGFCGFTNFIFFSSLDINSKVVSVRRVVGVIELYPSSKVTSAM